MAVQCVLCGNDLTRLTRVPNGCEESYLYCGMCGDDPIVACAVLKRRAQRYRTAADSYKTELEALRGESPKTKPARDYGRTSDYLDAYNMCAEIQDAINVEGQVRILMTRTASKAIIAHAQGRGAIDITFTTPSDIRTLFGREVVISDLIHNSPEYTWALEVV